MEKTRLRAVALQVETRERTTLEGGLEVAVITVVVTVVGDQLVRPVETPVNPLR